MGMGDAETRRAPGGPRAQMDQGAGLDRAVHPLRISRRFLPSMSLLHAFEAAARHQTFTAAAKELNLTQSAVSRHVRMLEDQLGAALFRRDRQVVSLTLAGEAYAAEVREALRRVADATLRFKANPTGGTLDLGVLPTFGSRWLIPRLPGFFAQHPDITINLSTRADPFDFSSDRLNAAVHFGAAEWYGAELDPLMSEIVVPACSPAFRARWGVSRPRDLRDVPLLHLVSRPDAWERWFAANGVEHELIPGMLFDQFSAAAHAAAAGLGVALLPRFLVAAELARGELVEVCESAVESAGRYYLAWPVGRGTYPPLQAFRAWLRRAMADAD